MMRTTWEIRPPKGKPGDYMTMRASCRKNRRHLELPDPVSMPATTIASSR